MTYQSRKYQSNWEPFMPLLKPILTDTYRIYIWQITESLDDLISLLKTNLNKDCHNIKHLHHRKQYFAKLLILEFLELSKELYYNTNGKPFLTNKQHISISHSGAYVAVGISDKAIGIDIEKNNEKLVRIAHKFVGAEEKELLIENPKTGLQRIWTAKESIYKLIGKPGLSFKNDIHIQYFNKESGLAIVQNQNQIKLDFNNINAEFIICCAYFI